MRLPTYHSFGLWWVSFAVTGEAKPVIKPSPQMTTNQSTANQSPTPSPERLLLQEHQLMYQLLLAGLRGGVFTFSEKEKLDVYSRIMYKIRQ